MTVQEDPRIDQGTGDYTASLGEELKLLVDLVAERAAPWLESVVAAGHRGRPEGHPAEQSGPAEQSPAEQSPAENGPAEQSAAEQSAAEQSGAEQSGAEQSRPDQSEAGHTRTEQPASCAWCPLCAVVALARGERPELSTRVLEQAAQLVALLRAVLADRWHPDQGVHMPGFRPEGAAAGGEPMEPVPPARPTRDGAPRVQHIAVRKVGVREPADAGEHS